MMNTEIHQWSTAADLPRPMYHASAIVCEGQLYNTGWRYNNMDRYHVKLAWLHLFSECPPPVLCSEFIGNKIFEHIIGRQLKLDYGNKLLI